MKRERLTKKVELPFDYTYAPKCECIEMGNTVTLGQMLAYDGICAKLGQLEDIEEELGVDLATLFKALFEGAWFKDGEPASFIEFAKKPYLRTDAEPFAIDFLEAISIHYLKDYGKTWALTKEELE